MRRYFRYAKTVLRMCLLLFCIYLSIPLFTAAKQIYNKFIALDKFQQQVIDKEQLYKQSLQLIAEQKWEQAESALQALEDYKDAKVLATYVRIKEFVQNGNYQAALKSLTEIPNNYAGQFSTEISQLKALLSQGSASPQFGAIKEKTNSLWNSIIEHKQ